MNNSWYSARGLKRGLLLSLLACLVWIVGIYSFMQAQAAYEASKPQFEMTPVSLKSHNYVYETRT